MPEESKKNQHKTKNEPKDQRRRRQGRQPAAPVEKKLEKQPEQPLEKQSKEPKKPEYVPPGPEFYKNLKRETDEILKITEEANTKYKKKEIQSNWAKYEMPVESYEDIDEQENMGADYEKLIQAPATVGGHFQFKHEKSWDTDTGPSIYDKYFDINMDLLSLAVSTIPFYERNNIEQSMFSENDIATMNHRAAKFKHKYYNDKKYNTPEIEAQDKILKTLAGNNEGSETVKDESVEENNIDDNALTISEETLNIVENSNTSIVMDVALKHLDNDNEINVEEIKFNPDANTKTVSSNTLEHSEILFDADDISEKVEANKKPDIVFMKVEPPKEAKGNDEIKVTANKQITTPEDTPKNPVIESPEDLEKWLDDFLDG